MDCLDFSQTGVCRPWHPDFLGASGSGAGGLNTCAAGILPGACCNCQCQSIVRPQNLRMAGNGMKAAAGQIIRE
jgi:hypothetical protein